MTIWILGLNGINYSNVALPLPEECFVTDGIVNYPYLIFIRHCVTQKILVYISGPFKVVLGIYTRKNKIKFQCKGLLTSLTTVKNEI